MFKIVATKINPDLNTGAPATVHLSIFNQIGTPMLTIPIPGRLFPKDLKVGEQLCFIQESKMTTARAIANEAENQALARLE